MDSGTDAATTSSRLVRLGTDYPRSTTALMMGVTIILAVLAALPSIWPGAFPMLDGVKVDTDPENMLGKNEPVRVFHNEMKRRFGLNDMVVVGVVNETHPNGVFNVESLRHVYDLATYAATLRGEAIGESDPNAGVIEVDVLAPSTVDNIEQGAPGEVRFEWLMPRPPATEDEALAVRDKARRIPFLDGTLVSENGKAVALYLPITAKDLSYKVYAKLRAEIAKLDGDDRYFITGLPVANDTFGVEMFVQMAVSAPLAMLVIFLLLLWFFRKLVLILSPMIIALVSVIVTMALLVITGNTIHIMSSMIPIFIMPIAVLDSVHILSEFFERYQETKNRRATIQSVMGTLFTPMLYTSLTSAAGFASLALTPIPPVQVFGIFVAAGIMLAWVLTVAFIPAYVMLMSERSLANFGAKTGGESDAEAQGVTARFLTGVGRLTYRGAAAILVLTVLAGGLAAYGISRIQINDNPTKWFRKSHPIRVADRVLNEHFGGTYMAYLALAAPPSDDAAAGSVQEFAAALTARIREALNNPAVAEQVAGEAARLAGESENAEAFLKALSGYVSEEELFADDAAVPAWQAVIGVLTDAMHQGEPFKRPEVLAYMRQLQTELLTTGVVGKSNSLADVVMTVHREMKDGLDSDFRIPASAGGVAECLVQYQSSHRPNDLWHLVTQDYKSSSIWVQLKSGDNNDMSAVVDETASFMAANPPPAGLTAEWFGLTYINVIWQEKMVSGMLQAFLGSFLVVLLMMILLFRSGLWGLLSMIPLTVTIGLIYGVIGFVGKDYDMPVAVLSSLTLGLAVDFAIHFLARARLLRAQYPTWADSVADVFGEPALAIFRNIVIIAVGFLPLLAAPLVPYNTVGILLAAILLVSGAGTLLILPALIRYLEPLLFPKTKVCSVTCQCGTCVLSAVTAVALVLVNVHQFLAVGWTKLTWVSLVAIPILALWCGFMSRRRKCRVEQ
ncbi:MAG: MMPL family transporter [Candidatus Hydrogenedentes bacterium]|nr:MMPL family transporter [Candidatus Hydrogenedentota bacterium]